MNADHELKTLAHDVLEKAREKGIMIATAESCTGGMVAASLTDIAGSSAAFDCAFVTYSNEAKTMMLGIRADTVASHGAVSEAVARAMAEGALTKSRADVSVSITGIAGPGGGTAEKPVGLVHFAIAVREVGTCHSVQNFGNPGRSKVRIAATQFALKFLLNSLV